VLLNTTADNPYFQTWVGAFLQGLQQSGWSIGQNVRIDIRWAGGSAAEVRKQAAELAALAPDVILAHGDTTIGPLLQATHTVPIVFPVAADPVGAGYVDSLARPGGNATMRDAGDIERAVAAFARPSNGGLITTASSAANVYRDLIIKLARSTSFLRSFTSDPLLLPAAWLLMDPILPTNTGTRPAMSIVSLKGRSRPICRCRHRQNMSGSSTSKRRRRSA
jgi:hypothetical protein